MFVASAEKVVTLPHLSPVSSSRLSAGYVYIRLSRDVFALAVRAIPALELSILSNSGEVDTGRPKCGDKQDQLCPPARMHGMSDMT